MNTMETSHSIPDLTNFTQAFLKSFGGDPSPNSQDTQEINAFLLKCPLPALRYLSENKKADWDKTLALYKQIGASASTYESSHGYIPPPRFQHMISASQTLFHMEKVSPVSKEVTDILTSDLKRWTHLCEDLAPLASLFKASEQSFFLFAQAAFQLCEEKDPRDFLAPLRPLCRHISIIETLYRYALQATK